MSFTTTGPATAPVVTTGAATNVASGTARLNGTVDPKGRATTYTFEYGTTTSFGNITAVDNAGNAGGAVPVSLPVSGLSPTTTYLYRIVATNSAGSSTGPVMSFRTTALTPIYWADGTDIGRAGVDGSNVNRGRGHTRRRFRLPVHLLVEHHQQHDRPGEPRRHRGEPELHHAQQDAARDRGRLRAHLLVVLLRWGELDRPASIDGSGVSESLITGLDAPSQVAVGPGHVYWVNFSTNSIGRANLDGTGVNKTFIAVGERPTSLAVGLAHIYWTGLNSEAMGRGNLDGTGVNPSFISGLNGPQGWRSTPATSSGRASRPPRSGGRT